MKLIRPARPSTGMTGVGRTLLESVHVPNLESAKKRVRQDKVRNARNKWRKRRISNQIKTFLKAVHDHDVEAAEAEFRKTCGLLDKISHTSTLHKNTASRKKSRLAKRLNAMKQASNA